MPAGHGISFDREAEPAAIIRNKEALSKYGGTVLKSSLSNETQAELQEALHGEGPGQ